MEVIRLRAVPVGDEGGLVVLNWHSRPPQEGSKEWVIHGLQGLFWPGDKGALVSGIFPYAALETLGSQNVSSENPVFSTLFGYFTGHNRNLAVRGQATSASSAYVTGDYFRGLEVSPAAGRLITSHEPLPDARPDH